MGLQIKQLLAFIQCKEPAESNNKDKTDYITYSYL